MVQKTCLFVCALLMAAVAGGVEKDVDPVAFVKAAIARGEKTIRVPKGKYFIDTEDTTFFRLRGLKDVTLDFGGSELICGKRTRYVGLDHCTNCVVRNAFFDMDPLPYVQGVIEKVLPDDVWEVRVLDDYAQGAVGPDQGGRLGGVTPEYEWFEGGFGNDILFRNNRFIGYENRERIVIGGRAAYEKTIPASAHVGVREQTTD